MKRTPTVKPAAPPVKPKTLSQAQADFTAEGSPPPGQVAGTPPAQPSGARVATPAKPKP